MCNISCQVGLGASIHLYGHCITTLSRRCMADGEAGEKEKDGDLDEHSDLLWLTLLATP